MIWAFLLFLIYNKFFTFFFKKEINRFYNRIKHGDSEHQDWLKKEFESFFDMKIKED